MKKIIIGFIFAIFFLGKSFSSVLAAPAISGVVVVTTGNIEKYAKFEVRFDVETVATNKYFPYDSNPSPGVERRTDGKGTGVSVDMFLTQTDWNSPKIVPCFYYQPVEEVSSGGNVALSPIGKMDFRCRFSTETKGIWKFKLRATDAGGTFETAESSINQFNVVDPSPTSFTRKGYIRDSQIDARFFEYSDGTPFVTPLLNSNPWSGESYSLADSRASIATLGQNGIHFLRWFPTGEGGKVINPFGDSIEMEWGFGNSYVGTDGADTQNKKVFSWSRPYYYSGQVIPLKASSTYRLSFWANVEGQQVLRAEIPAMNVHEDICSSTNIYHAQKKVIDGITYLGETCTAKKSGWNYYEFLLNSSSDNVGYVYMRGLYVGSDADNPYKYSSSVPTDGTISIHDIKLQRDENNNSSNRNWGGNVISRGDPDTYNYIDQIQSARMDDLLTQSEKFGVYHKLTLFHKKEIVLNSFDATGQVVEPYKCSWNNPDPEIWWDFCPKNFYSGPGEPVRFWEMSYVRYFLARFAYSPAIHSIEQDNENDIDGNEENWLQSGYDIAKYISENSPRKILVSNSFWGFMNAGIWMDSTNGKYYDFADKHWYADHRSATCSGSGNDGTDPCGVISNLWSDTVANMRYTYTFFKQFASDYNYQKPIIRGETGVADSGTQPQDPNIAAETTGVYYHKQLWSHVGVLGYSTGGEWYPRLWEIYSDTLDPSDPNYNKYFPTTINNTFKIYAAFDKFMKTDGVNYEPLNNGTHVEIGTDNAAAKTTSCSAGANCITTSNSNLRAFGSKDPQTKRVLVWVDNKNNTWSGNPRNTTIASGTFVVFGMPPGVYTKETWDTRVGTFTTQVNAVTVGTDGMLTFSASTAKDIAFKFYVPGGIQPTSTPTLTPTCGFPGDIDCSGLVNAVDLSKLILKFGQTYSGREDVDGSGQVNAIDLAILLSNFGK
jgi:hypothetical protein